MADQPSDSEVDQAVSDTLPATMQRVQFSVPGWLRRIGTVSWFFIGTVIALGVLVALIAATRDITAPLALGVLLAIVFVPVVNWLEGHHIGRAAGSALVLVGLVVVIGGSAFITADALADQSDVLSESLEQAVVEIKSWSDDLPISERAVEEVDSATRDAAPVVRDGLASSVARFVDSAAALVAGLVLGTMVLYYMLKDGPKLTRGFVSRRRDPAAHAAAQRVVDRSIQDVQRYFAGKTALALVNGFSIAIGMYLFGVPGALAIGVVNFVGAYIPYIGAFIGGAFAVLMALGEGGIVLALTAFVIVMVAQVVLENLLEPKLLGSSLDLHPLAILLATALGGMVAGMIGLILAAPVLAIGLDLFRELKAVGFFGDEDDAELLGESRVPE